jgi:two-component system cell cycle sensor histidine kinase/response regulator CckA
VEQAETRTEQAEARTEQAKTRAELAETRTEQAETRTEQAEARTEQAKTRTEQAEMRTEQAETRSEQAIHSSELSYRRLFEACRDGLLIMEVGTGRISDVNPCLVEMLGFSHVELVGKPIWELDAFKDLVSSQARLDELCHQGYGRHDHLSLITRDGRKIAVEFVCSAYQAGDGNVIQCNVRDITERKRIEAEVCGLNTELKHRGVEHQELEAQFIEAQKMEVLGRLAGGVAHDFNNILAVIMGHTSLVQQTLAPEDPRCQDIEAMQEAAERAVALTRQLLVFCRKEILQPVVLDLNEVVKGVENMLRQLIQENVELKFMPGTSIGRIKADSGYVGQVLMNLVVNARDAMPEGGRLVIETNGMTVDETNAHEYPSVKPGDYVVLAVRDTGNGMTDEVKARLFEPMFTTKPKGKGTGLGLITCQTIVQQSGGHIVVHSVLGAGTAFQIFFPRVDQPLDESARSNEAGPLPQGTERLLVVEDEPAVRQLARVVLAAQGYDVLCAANGEDGLRMAREQHEPPIRLVITDVIMPEMDGNVMANSLTSTDPELKILFTSGYNDDALAHHGVLNPGVDFLPKPYTPATLTRKVRDLLDRAAAHTLT